MNKRGQLKEVTFDDYSLKKKEKDPDLPNKTSNSFFDNILNTKTMVIAIIVVIVIIFSIIAITIGYRQMNIDNLQNKNVTHPIVDNKTPEIKPKPFNPLLNSSNKPIPTTPVRRGGGGGGGSSDNGNNNIPICIPSKTCLDYSGLCGSGLLDGCNNILDCSNNCLPGYDCIGLYCVLTDFNVPIFSNFYDNSNSVKVSGLALFNVTVININGSVFLSIDGKNYSATNLVSNVYNVSLNLTSGYYEYFWYGYGNSSNKVFNRSISKNYNVNGTIYYISSSMGNDSNDGLTINTPWKSVRKVYLKSISTNRFQPNDNILLKAGDSFFDGNLWIANSGKNNSPIIISKYGSGENPIIYGDHPTVYWLPYPGHLGIYYSEMYGGGINDVYDFNGNLYNQTQRGTDTIDNWLNTLSPQHWGFEFSPERIYVHTPDDNPPPELHLFEWSVVYASRTANYTIIENLDVRNGNIGIAVATAFNVIIRNNSVQDTIDIGIYSGSKATNAEIAYNNVNRTGETSIYLSEGRNNWVHHNIISNSNGNILNISYFGRSSPERCGVGLERGVGNLVEFNSLSFINQSLFDYWLENDSIVRYNYGFHSGGGAYPDGVGLKVHNNIFNLDGAGEGFGGSYDGGNTPTVNPNLIYNNVIYNFIGYGIYSANNSYGEIFRNNILVMNITNRYFVELNNGMDIDFNCYYNTSGPINGWIWNNKGYKNLTSYSTISGQDSHSIYANPKFVVSNPVGPQDFQLDTTSPCINTGFNLKAAGLIEEGYEYNDFIGRNIPQGAGADIGVYEVDNGISPSEFIQSSETITGYMIEVKSLVIQNKIIDYIKGLFFRP